MSEQKEEEEDEKIVKRFFEDMIVIYLNLHKDRNGEVSLAELSEFFKDWKGEWLK